MGIASGSLTQLRQAFLRVAPAAGIFLSVGLLVGAWSAAGVTALLIDRGLGLLTPGFFLPGAALLGAAVAFATGTSWGAVATMGVALMGVAAGLGVSPALAAGAIVAGTHFGDKLSPLSETATLASTVSGTDLYTHLRHTAYTTVPAFLVALLLYTILGGPGDAAPWAAAGQDGAPWAAAGLEDTPLVAAGSALRERLAAAFRLHPLLWLPPGVVLVAAVLRWPVIPSLLGSAAVAGVLAVTIQDFPLSGLPALAWWGYRGQTGDPALDQLLSQGGLAGVIQLSVVAVGLFLATSGLIRTGPGRRLLALVERTATTPARAVTLAVLLALGIMILSGATYLSVLVTGEVMRAAFRRQGLAAENLSRTLEDSGTVVAPLIPWGVSGLFAARTLGVATLEYAPYALVNYLGVVLALLYAHTGWFIKKTRAAS